MAHDEIINAGFKVTVPRLRVFELLAEAGGSHMSADDIYRALLAEGLKVGSATIYTVLSQFETAGLVKRLKFENEKSVFELADESHHDHLVCTKCGKIEEFFDKELEQRKVMIANQLGYQDVHHNLSIYGVCADCQ